MRRWLPTVLAVAALGAAFLVLRPADGADPAPPEPSPGQDCSEVTFEGQRFTECVAVPGRHRIGTRVTGSSDLLYRGFAALAEDLDASKVAFAVNAGMYDVRSRPIGYYVEDGERLHPLNTRSGPGNFHMKPNGVFFGEADGSWRVMASEDFASQVTDRPEFGTQSGPMLLTGGKLHPRISPHGTSLKIRNAVGVDDEGRAHFVISEQPVSFGTMARMMRDHARTDDALFLDGTVSALWYPAGKRMDSGYPLGPLIVVEELR